MSRMSCDIIRDLLPLYHDSVCSADSAALVEEHLETCAPCRETLRRMDAPVCAETQTEGEALRAVGRVWDRARRRSFHRGLAIGGGCFLGLALFVGIFFCFFSVARMPGCSMEPTIAADARCVVSRFASPERGDIVAVPLDWGDIVITDVVRIVGAPGDTVSIENGTLYVNGEASALYEPGAVLPGDISYPVTLGREEYFVMGDNQGNSFDSRDLRYGLVSRENIRGVLVIALP